MIRFFIFFLLVVELFSTTKGYEYLKDKPHSRAKDFYTLLYLEKSKDSIKSKQLFYGVRNLKSTHISRLEKIDNDSSLKEMKRCRKLSSKELLKERLECSLIGFSLSKATLLSSNQQLLLAMKYEKADKYISKILYTMSYGVKFSVENIDISLKIFNGAGWTYRNKKLNIRLSPKFIKKAQSNWRMNKTMEYVALSLDLGIFGDSLMGVDPNKLSSKGAFFYGILAIKKGLDEKAISAFKSALKKERRSSNIDKLNFWLWKLTKDKKYYKKVLESSNINIYTLYIREKSKKDFFKIYTKAPSIEKSKKLSKTNCTDPFFWGKLLSDVKSSNKKECKKLLYKLGGNEAEPFRAFVYNYINNYKRDYYINPWKKNLKGKSIPYQALILSLARQESRFIPSALSRSFAIGAMQMMPFLIKHIGRSKKENIFLPEFFNKDRILPYAFGHINWLEKNANSPLYVAYAYNGGLGFTRRNVYGKLFKGHKYDPFLSMELVPAGETREYGKKVLSNYYVYRKILKKPVTFNELFRDIKKI